MLLVPWVETLLTRAAGWAGGAQAQEGISAAGGMKPLAAAAAVGGAVGMMVSGPVLALAGAGAAAYGEAPG